MDQSIHQGVQEQAHQHAGEISVATTKVLPPVAATTMYFMGIPINSWLVVLTCIYTLLQICVLVHTQYTKFRTRRLPVCRVPEEKDANDD